MGRIMMTPVSIILLCVLKSFTPSLALSLVGSVLLRLQFRQRNAVSPSMCLQMCTSTRVEAPGDKFSKRTKAADRFIHPQVFKMFRRAQYLIRNGDNVIAQKLLIRCLELNPFDSHSWLALARLEAKLGNVERARDLFSQSVIRCPNNVHILHAWGHMEQKHGNEALARECWSKALEIDPYNAYVCHALSNLERRLNNFDRAKEMLELVFNNKPTSAICVSLAELERQLGDPDRAKELLLQGLSVCNTERSKILLALAWVEEDVFGEFEGASELLRRAMVEDPRNVRVHIAKASMELRARKIHDARKTLLAASLLDSEDGQHFTMWGTLELECGNYKEARHVLEEGAKLYPGDHFLLQRWGTLEAKYGSVRKARELFSKSASIQPHAPTFVAWAIMEEDRALEALGRSPSYTHVEPHDNGVTDVGSGAIGSGNTILDIDNLLGLSVAFDSDADGHGFDDSGSQTVTIGKADTKATKKQFQALTRDPPITFGHVHASDSGPQVKLASHQQRSHDSAGGVGALIRLPTGESNADIDSGTGRDTGANSDLMLLASSKGKLDWFQMEVTAQEFAHSQLLKARELFSAGMFTDPQHGPLYHAYGNMEMRHGNISGARAIFTRGIKMNCTDVTSLYHAWGVVEMRDHEVTKAAEIFRKGVEIAMKGSREVDPSVGFLLHSLGMLELEFQRPEEAKKVFSLGVSLFPQHSTILLGLAMAEVRMGLHEDARQRFRASVDADSLHAHAWQVWALFEKQSGNIELARILFRQGLKKNPSHGPLWQAYAVLELQQNNIDTARSLFAQSLQRCPTHAQSYQAWACLEVRLGNLAKAKELTLQGLKRTPNHPALWTVAGLVEARMGDVSSARAVLEAGVLRFPTHGALYKVLGEFEGRQGNYAKAREYFAEGAERDRNYMPLYHAAALLEAKLGNLEGLSELHKMVKSKFIVNSTTVHNDNLDVIEKIIQLEQTVRESGAAGDGHNLTELDLEYYDRNETFPFSTIGR